MVVFLLLKKSNSIIDMLHVQHLYDVVLCFLIVISLVHTGLRVFVLRFCCIRLTCRYLAIWYGGVYLEGLIALRKWYILYLHRHD